MMQNSREYDTGHICLPSALQERERNNILNPEDRKVFSMRSRCEMAGKRDQKQQIL